MRSIRTVVLGLLLASSSVYPAQAAEWKILEPAHAPRAYAVAAREFQKFYAGVTGAALPVVSEPDASNLVVIGSDSVNGFCRAAVEQGIIPPLGLGADTDDYCIKSARKDGQQFLFLAGGNGRATLYAVYDFFERRAGCRYFWDGDIIPKQDAIDMADLDVSESPRFAYRGIRYFAHRSLDRFQAEHWGPEQWEREIDWVLKKRLNLFMLRIGLDDLYQRAFPDIVPYPPDDAPSPEAVPRSYDDRTTAWPLRYRGELREHVLEYARERGLIHPEDTGTMTHWYSRTPNAFLDSVKPSFMPQSGGAYRGNPTGAVWDIRDDRNLENYWKLTQAHIAVYGRPEMFHTIGLAERNVFKDRAQNHETKLYAYRRIIGKLREHYREAPILIGSWDFYYPGWKGDEVAELLTMLNPRNTFIFDYTSDLPGKSFRDWQLVGNFPWFFGLLHAYEWENDLRGNYDAIRERLPIATADPMCQGFVLWPENSHADILMLEFFTHNAWQPDILTPEELLPNFCRDRYPDHAPAMLAVWQSALPLIKMHRELPPEFRRLANFAKREVTQERVKQYEGLCGKAQPRMDELPALCRALGELPYGTGNAFIDRDAIDLARTMAGRAFTQALYTYVISQGKWAQGEASPEDVQTAGQRCTTILTALRDILALHEDYSLNVSMARLASTHPINPCFEQTLKGNAENSYCRTYIFELFDDYYLKQLSLYTEWVGQRVSTGDAGNPFKPAEPLPMAAITDGWYGKPLAEMAPPDIENPGEAYRAALGRLAAAVE